MQTLYMDHKLANAAVWKGLQGIVLACFLQSSSLSVGCSCLQEHTSDIVALSRTPVWHHQPLWRHQHCLDINRLVAGQPGPRYPKCSGCITTSRVAKACIYMSTRICLCACACMSHPFPISVYQGLKMRCIFWFLHIAALMLKWNLPFKRFWNIGQRSL